MKTSSLLSRRPLLDDSAHRYRDSLGSGRLRDLIDAYLSTKFQGKERVNFDNMVGAMGWATEVLKQPQLELVAQARDSGDYQIERMSINDYRYMIRCRAEQGQRFCGA
jgi:hypothetical protein